MIVYRSPTNDKERAALLLHLSTSTPNTNIEAASGNYPFAVPTVNQHQINSDAVAPTISCSPMLSTDENENSSASQFEDAAEFASFVYTPHFLQHISSSSTMMAPFANAFLMNQQQQQKHVPSPMQQVPSTNDMQLQFQAAATKAHLSMLKQQQERDFYLAMANSNPSTTPQPPSLGQPNMFLGPQSFPMQSMGGSSGRRKRQSHSAQAIRHANAKGQQPMPLQPLPSFMPMANAATQRQQVPVMPLSHQMTVDDFNKRNMARRGTGVCNTVETASITAATANHRDIQTMSAGSSTEIIAAKVTAAASFESRPLQAVADAIAEDSFPKPDVDSWMYKLEEVHPSPVIQTIEGDAPIRVTTVVSDTETKQTPIAEDHVTRYDILAGRGGKTNHHEGNIKFRRLVTKYKKDYLCAKKFTKRNLVSKIVHFVRQGRGRFLQRDPKDGNYYEIGDERAFAKLAQSMREGSSVASICREFAASHHNRDHFEQQMIMADVNKTSNKRTPTTKSLGGEEQRGANPSAKTSPSVASLPFRKRLV